MAKEKKTCFFHFCDIHLNKHINSSINDKYSLTRKWLRECLTLSVIRTDDDDKNNKELSTDFLRKKKYFQ